MESIFLLQSLRWDVDSLIINCFNERVWLKPSFVNGKRIGITDCCFYDNECDHHKQVRKARNVIESN